MAGVYAHHEQVRFQFRCNAYDIWTGGNPNWATNSRWRRRCPRARTPSFVLGFPILISASPVSAGNVPECPITCRKVTSTGALARTCTPYGSAWAIPRRSRWRKTMLHIFCRGMVGGITSGPIVITGHSRIGRSLRQRNRRSTCGAPHARACQSPPCQFACRLRLADHVPHLAIHHDRLVRHVL